jgi:CRP/FNR family transcriptional regulator
MRDVPYVRRPITTNPPNSPTPSQCHGCGARHIGLCDALSDDDLGFLARVAQRVSMPAGKAFIEEGSSSNYFYDINVGDVCVHKSLSDGRRQITGFMGIGHFLGLSVSGKYAFSAEALNDVQMCRFERVSLLSVFAEFPAIEKKLLEVAVHEMVIAQEQMLLLGRKTALERVASFIDTWTERHAIPQDRLRSYTAVKFLLPMNRMDLADYLGLTSETVSRSFSRLRRDGLIDFSNAQEIAVLQPNRISAMATG